MNQEAKNAPDKPVLNPENFHRLLAAAYLLQVHNDAQPSIRPIQPVSASHASSFAAGAIVQKRTPSVTMRERQLQAAQSDAVPGNEMAKQHRYPARLAPFVGPAVEHKIKLLLRRPMSWKTVEPLAIAIVFCTMMGLSIHRLSSVPDRASLASGVLEEQNDFQPAKTTIRPLASSPTVVTQNSRQSPIGREAHIVAEDIVIRHQKHGVNLVGKPGAHLAFRDAEVFAPDSVAQYGSDVTMWSRNSERATPPKIGGLSR